MTTALNVVVGVTGGIAAYKAVGVVRALVKAGHDVHVVPTQAALRFIGRPTFEAISRNHVSDDLYDDVAQVRHVAIGRAADLIIIAPATANTIAKLAHGVADDLLGNTVLASTAPLVVAPAMHTEMWNNPATVANIDILRRRGATIVGPATGQLTGDDSGPGRLVEPEDIVAAALAAVRPHAVGAAGNELAGRRVLVTAGGTREPLDPVRYIGNRSSGRQGIALARAAHARGASVTLIAAHIEAEVPAGIRVVGVSSALELRQAAISEAGAADVVIMAAAVADYRPATQQDTKIKKDDVGAALTLELVQNPDILAELAASKPAGQVVVGFAAETVHERDRKLELGKQKLLRKGCDYLVLNSVGWSEGFTSSSNDVIVLSAAGDIVMEASGTKLSVADRILDAVIST